MDNDGSNIPTTLVEAIRHFKDEETCIQYLVPRRWPDGITCYHCGSKEKHCYIKTRRIWSCKSCKKQFSLKKGTIFEESNISLQKWLISIWLIVNAKNGISSWELHRAIGISQKTAWFVLHRIRYALEIGGFDRMLSGIVEGDETYIGGIAENMHKDERKRKIPGRGTVGKQIVQGFVERNGEVRASHIKDHLPSTFHAHIRANIEPGSTIYTDQHKSYAGLGPDYFHDFVNHKMEYVRGEVHTNTIENFWCLLKRTQKGTYVSVEPFHLNRYVSEQVFRYNHRKGSDQDRFLAASIRMKDGYLSYKGLVQHLKKPRRGGPKKS